MDINNTLTTKLSTKQGKPTKKNNKDQSIVGRVISMYGMPENPFGKLIYGMI